MKRRKKENGDEVLEILTYLQEEIPDLEEEEEEERERGKSLRRRPKIKPPPPSPRVRQLAR